jgi:cation diffusion facilitator family transporter
MEYISSMIVSFLIMLVGVELLTDSMSKLFSPKDAVILDITNITVIMLSVSIVIKLMLGIFYFSVAKAIDSPVVKGAGIDSISDSVATSAILASSITIKYTGFVMLDSIVGLAVAVMIFIAGAKILIETKNKLLGEGPVDETVKAINDIVAGYPEILGVHDMMVHNYGPKNFISSFHAEVDGKGDFMHLHDMIDNCEKEISKKLGILCTIHLDPIATDDEEVVRYKEIVRCALSEINFDYPIHDFRVVIGNTHTNLIFDIVLPFELKISDAIVAEKISSKIKEKDETLFSVITIDRA